MVMGSVFVLLLSIADHSRDTQIESLAALKETPSRGLTDLYIVAEFVRLAAQVDVVFIMLALVHKKLILLLLL